MIDEVYPNQQKRSMKYAWAMKMFGIRTGMLVTESHELHRIRRGIFAHFLSKTTLHRLEPGIQAVLDKLVSRLEALKGTGRNVNLKDVFACLTGDIIGQYAFARPYGFLDDPDFTPSWHKMLMDVSENSHLLKQFSWIMPLMMSLPDWLVKSSLPQMWALIEFQRVCFLRGWPKSPCWWVVGISSGCHPSQGSDCQRGKAPWTRNHFLRCTDKRWRSTPGEGDGPSPGRSRNHHCCGHRHNRSHLGQRLLPHHWQPPGPRKAANRTRKPHVKDRPVAQMARARTAALPHRRHNGRPPHRLRFLTPHAAPVSRHGAPIQWLHRPTHDARQHDLCPPPRQSDLLPGRSNLQTRALPRAALFAQASGPVQQGESSVCGAEPGLLRTLSDAGGDLCARQIHVGAVRDGSQWRAHDAWLCKHVSEAGFKGSQGDDQLNQCGRQRRLDGVYLAMYRASQM